jgi:hypothetical protein
MNAFPITAEQLAERLRAILENCTTPVCRLSDGDINPHFKIGWLQGDLANALNLLAVAAPLESEPLEDTRQLLLARYAAPAVNENQEGDA